MCQALIADAVFYYKVHHFILTWFICWHFGQRISQGYFGPWLPSQLIIILLCPQQQIVEP